MLSEDRLDRLFFAIYSVEIQTRYRDFVRPEGLEIERVVPPGG